MAAGPQAEFMVGGPPPDDPTPRVCAVAANIPAFDLGHYRGVWRVIGPDGKPFEPGAPWHACPVRRDDEKPWTACGFSLCHVPDGLWQVEFSALPSPVRLQARLRGGVFVDQPPDAFGYVAGDVGYDATGRRWPAIIDLGGFAGAWSILDWPEPGFHGTDTAGRGEKLPPDAPPGAVMLSLFPQTTYGFRFGAGPVQTLTLRSDGTAALAAGHSLAPVGVTWPRTRLALRVRAVRIGAPGVAWRLAGTPHDGVERVVLPANSAWPVESGSARGMLRLDADCAARLDGVAALPVEAGKGCVAGTAPSKGAGTAPSKGAGTAPTKAAGTAPKAKAGGGGRQRGGVAAQH